MRVDKNRAWRFWVDRGGTFTDVIGIAPDGHVETRKLLSERVGTDSEAALIGIGDILGIDPFDKNEERQVFELRLGTTVATNALLQRKGAKTALLITRGFGDALRIGYQNRPQLFAREIRLPAPLYSMVIECNERTAADGGLIEALDEDELERKLIEAKNAGINSLAVVFLHAYAHSHNERRAADLSRQIGFSNVSASHEVNPVIKLVARGDTTVVDAYLNPVLRAYTESMREQLANRLTGPSLLFMQSNGGLTTAGAFRGKDSVLSGPAGGVVGMVESAAAEGFGKAIGFDMGGTSTDVSIYDGRFERSEEMEIAGARLRSAMLRIHTVAAGGGSILSFKEGRLQVGPHSAGARPGPAAYGAGGPLTVTDCSVLLGRLQPNLFPQIFGDDGRSPLQLAAVKRKFEALVAELSAAGFKSGSLELAELFQDIAVQRMARAIKKVALDGGHDLSDFVLVAFGGAGPQHACQVADELGISRILVHPLAGLLSALGIGLAPVSSVLEKTVRLPLDESGLESLANESRALRHEARREMQNRLADEDATVTTETTVKLRYAGTDTSLPVAAGDVQAMRRQFEQEHLARFGFASPEKPLLVESLMVLAQSGSGIAAPSPASAVPGKPAKCQPAATHSVHFQGRDLDTGFFVRQSLAPNDKIPGPAVIIEDGATTVIEPGWIANLTQTGQLLMTRLAEDAAPAALHLHDGDTRADPARLEVFNNLFMHIAEQMGAVLRNTARSVNIKERLDFSCAVFDAAGALVANAPHMPVHLGSMGESVKAVIRDNPAMRPGDVYMLNDPYRGGTHLPDITVVTPVFLAGERAPDLFVAARGHHADVGGISPGSMPPHSKHIEQEGVLFSNFLLVREGHFREAELAAALCNPPYPARNPEQNIADLKAQVAACRQGERLLYESAGRFGLDVLRAYLQHIQDNAEEAVRHVLSRLDDGNFDYPLDNGLLIRVAVRVNRNAREATVDFSGSSLQHDGNFNAPFAVCRAAVLYVFRCLVDAPIPLNAGCLKPIRIIAPEGSILNPYPPAAVVAGNVETSQAITNALFGALGTMAAAQGTMNNFTFGDEHRQYYETIAGGAGAGPGFRGADAVQTHMTNSRLTDAEVLELRFPVRLREFSIRQGSGGAGQHAGGNGVTRDIEFLAPMQAAILSGHRDVPPFGLHGGKPGRCGHNVLRRSDGQLINLGATASVKAEPGDRIIIETPGGGGFGKPDSGA
ncbi:MAG: 5-oxoprolinase [Gammaproteobacteria bacterium]|nr:5-oxoprolinase [Gammaproteobacteria bacterium]